MSVGVRWVHAFLLDAGIDFRGTKFSVGVIHLISPCTLYDTLLNTIIVVIYDICSDFKRSFSRNGVSLRSSNNPLRQGGAAV